MTLDALPPHVAKRVTVDEDGCWRWTGETTTDGYGRLYAGDGPRPMAHRFVYEALIGPIPSGLELDHLCRVRNCVNPLHLEPVTQRENTLRSLAPAAFNAVKTACKWGHPFTPENTYVYPKPSGRSRRKCKTCACHPNSRKVA